MKLNSSRAHRRESSPPVAFSASRIPSSEFEPFRFPLEPVSDSSGSLWEGETKATPCPQQALNALHSYLSKKNAANGSRPPSPSAEKPNVNKVLYIIISKAWKRVSVGKVPVGRPRWGREGELSTEMGSFTSLSLWKRLIFW